MCFPLPVDPYKMISWRGDDVSTGMLRYRYKPEPDFVGTFEMRMFAWTGSNELDNKNVLSLESVIVKFVVGSATSTYTK